MATTRTTSAAKALAALVIPPLVVAIVALTAQTSAQATPSTSSKSKRDACRGAYGWPVAPFDEAHPVRANFGDPRTRFDGPDTADTLIEGDGTFSFHQGVDISARDGSPVYAVASGRSRALGVGE
jgi:murein DD-endopeptidase MepM/ murein hydrolase activator NlpD